MEPRFLIYSFSPCVEWFSHIFTFCKHRYQWHLLLSLVIFDFSSKFFILFFHFVLLGTEQATDWKPLLCYLSCLTDHKAGEEARIRKEGEAEMECLIDPGREQAKWTVICSVLIHLRMLSVLLTSFSLGGLSSTVLPWLLTHNQFLSLYHTQRCALLTLSHSLVGM